MAIHMTAALLLALLILGGCRSANPEQVPEGRATQVQSSPPLWAANEGNNYHWNVTIRPQAEESGHFTFEASLMHSRPESDEGNRGTIASGASDEFRVPRMTVIAGKETAMEIPGPDGEPALSARVLIDAAENNISYWVMIKTQEGIHSSSAELGLSANQPDAGNGD